ncbi:ATP-binding cassette domain-containing protein, partial [Sinorhizobium meliloti]
SSLSGGNQQKVVLAKWFHAGGDVIILDEPTRGALRGARHHLTTRASVSAPLSRHECRYRH